MLDLMETALKMGGFVFYRLDGKQTEEQRRSTLDSFRRDVHYSILLASIGSAGVGCVMNAIMLELAVKTLFSDLRA